MNTLRIQCLLAVAWILVVAHGHAEDTPSVEERMVRRWTDQASRGADLALPEEPSPLLKSWLEVNGESLFGVSASPLRPLPWGRCTLRTTDAGSILFFHILDWPSDGVLRVPGLESDPRAVRVLWTDVVLDWKRRDEGLEIGLPLAQMDPLCTVLRLDFTGAVRVADVVVRPERDGRLVLSARLAELNSPDPDQALRLERKDPRARHNIGFWTDSRAWVRWTLERPKPGAYDLSVVFANPSEQSRIRIQTGGQRIESTLGTTGSWDLFRTSVVCRLRYETEGRSDLILRPVPTHWYPINVRDVILTPVR